MSTESAIDNLKKENEDLKEKINSLEWTHKQFKPEIEAHKQIEESIMNRLLVITHELQTLVLQLASAKNDPTKLFGRTTRET